MNTNLLAINNISAGTPTPVFRQEDAGAGPLTLRYAVTEDTKPFSLTLADNPERPTTDNSRDNNAKDCSTSNQSEEFSDTTCRKTALQTPDKSNDKANIRTESPNDAASPAGNPVQFASSQESPTAQAAIVKGSVILVDSGCPETQNSKLKTQNSASFLHAISKGQNATNKVKEGPQTAEKTPALNYKFPPTQGKSLEAEQKVSVSPKKSALIAEKTVDSLPFAKSTDYHIADRKTPSGPLDSNGEKQSDNSYSDSLLQKLNLTGLQISVGQNKDGGNPTLKHRSLVLNSQFIDSASNENPASSVVFGKFLASTQAAKTANPPGQVSLGDVSKSIGEQIIESIHASLHKADKHITIRLEPPELGKVFLRFQEQKDEIIGLLEVSKAQTRYEIEQALPQMIRTLADSGIQIKRLEVQLSSQSEQQAGKGQSAGADQLLDDGAFESAWADSFERDSSGNASAGETVMDTYSYDDIRDQHEMFVTDGSINMLV